MTVQCKWLITGQRKWKKSQDLQT
ncbi:rCG24508 [Rattus norvegicus]|uniref:RCG24508 n=1 Tax=Rattus norvegicus TaxID=10116 RepID=A6K6S3_RAT|nr:rCG24508 [Rattus norvegicus]